MVTTVEKLKQHIDKAKKNLRETLKASENPRTSHDVRKKKKKVKRLTRKAAKTVYMEKKLAEKSAKKKKAGGEG